MLKYAVCADVFYEDLCDTRRLKHLNLGASINRETGHDGSIGLMGDGRRTVHIVTHCRTKWHRNALSYDALEGIIVSSSPSLMVSTL